MEFLNISLANVSEDHIRNAGADRIRRIPDCRRMSKQFRPGILAGLRIQAGQKSYFILDSVGSRAGRTSYRKSTKWLFLRHLQNSSGSLEEMTAGRLGTISYSHIRIKTARSEVETFFLGVSTWSVKNVWRICLRTFSRCNSRSWLMNAVVCCHCCDLYLKGWKKYQKNWQEKKERTFGTI